MANVSNLIVLLDAMNSAIVMQQRISAIVSKAAAEGRDVSQEEMDEVFKESETLHQRVLNEL